MPAPECCSSMLSLLGYGPLPGVELIPYAIALLVWLGLAFFSVLLWPFSALIRLFRGVRQPTETVSNAESMTTPALSAPVEENQNLQT